MQHMQIAIRLVMPYKMIQLYYNLVSVIDKFKRY